MLKTQQISVLFMFLTFLLLTCNILSTEQADTLELGKSYFHDLNGEQSKYFVLPQLTTPLVGETKLIFTLTSISGDADIYLSFTNQNPGPESYDLKSSTREDDLIEIDSTKSSGPYYVAVKAFKKNAYFSIIAYRTDGHIEVQDGIPQVAHVIRRGYTYFKYDASEPFTISSTAIYGDPDIYVSDIVEFPNNTNYLYKKSGAGSDLLKITPTEPKTFYIAVYGFGSDAYYNLEITSRNGTALLSAGIPLLDSVPFGEYKYYKYKLAYEADMVIKVLKKTFSGDPTLYVSTTNERPDAHNYEWKSENDWRSEELTISAAHAGYYYLSVYDNSEYFDVDVQIVIEFPQTSQIITSGSSFVGTVVADKDVYYKAYFEMKDGDHAKYMEITATTATGGQVQLYASNNAEFPTRENAQFIGNDIMSSNVIHINEPTKGWLYISLHGIVNANYTITVTQAKQFITLDPAVPASFNINGGQYRDFVFQADRQNEHDIVVSLYSIDGDADVYISTSPNVSRTEYLWKSTKGYSDVLTIYKNDPARKRDDYSGQLFIAVYGFIDSYFSITAFFANSTVEIFDGLPITGIVARGDYSYFKYYMHNSASLSISLRTSGDADLYVSRQTPYPNNDNHEWKSWKVGDDFLNIEYASQDWYYIGVYGYRANQSFVLTVTSGVESLSGSGYSLVDYVAKGQYRYYKSYMLRDTDYPVITGVTLVSGHTELYVNNNSTLPSNTAYKYSDTTWPGNFISVAPAEATDGTWSFAVYGVENSYYYMHASGRDVQGVLRRGEPKIGLVKKGGYAYFRYPYEYGVTSTYSVYVNQINSIPSRVGVYVDQYPNKHPNVTSNKWHAEETDDILLALPNADVDEGYYISIHAYDADVRFQISFDLEDEPVYLTEDQPNKVSTKVGKSHYFEVPAIPILPGQKTSKLQVVVSSCADVAPPVLYGSITEHRPNKDNKQFQSEADGKYRQKMTSPEEEYTNGLYYVGTEASTRDYIFSIYGTTSGDNRPVINGTIELGELVSTTEQRVRINKAIGNEPIRYFMYKRVLASDETRDSINMQTVCAIQNGKADLVGEITRPSTRPNQLYYDIDVSSNERYVINVVAVDSYGLASAYDALDFNIGGSYAIELGKPLRGYVNETSYTRFKLPAVSIPDNGFLTFALTPFSGDVDLYIGTTETFDKHNATWKSNDGGFDMFTLHKSDVPDTTDLYVAVYGSSPGQSYFSIMAAMKGMSQELEDGQPQIASVTARGYTYFKFYLPDNSSFAFTVTPISGDPELLVSTEYDKPTRENAKWSSDGMSIEYLSIENTDPDFKEGVEYFIGIYGWSESKFEITVARQDTIEQVTEGVPHGGKADDKTYDYFKFTLTSARGIYVTVLGLVEDTDPDIFVSTETERPSAQDCQWRQMSSGGTDTLFISKDDPNWKIGEYYIAVRGWLKATQFQLMVRSEEGSYLLADGAPQTLNPVIGGYTTFRFFYNYQRNAISFTLSSDVEGSVELYGARTTTKPTKEKHDWVGQTQGAYQTINIDVGSPMGWYFVSVYGKAKSNYTISATTNQRPIALFDGRLNIQNYVEMGMYAYFTFDFDSSAQKDIIISTRAEYGDPDIYVSTNVTRPTKDNFTWKTFDIMSDSVRIKSSELAPGTSRLYIGVHGFFASRFSIVAYSAGQTLEVYDATPTPGRVEANQYDQYWFELKNPGTFSISLNVLSGDSDFYVSREPNPSAAHYDYKPQTNFGSELLTIEALSASDVGKYYIGVHGAGRGGDYSLQVNTQYQTVAVGSYARDTAVKDKIRTYRTSISRDHIDHVVASVTLINGRTEFYISTNESVVPTREHHDFASKDYPGNVIYVRSTDPKFNSGTWVLTVYPVDDSDYFVSVQTNEGQLASGIPRVGYVDSSVAHRGALHYQYKVGWGVPKMVVNVRPFGDASSCLVVYGSQKNNTPSEDVHTWKGASSASVGGQILLVIDTEIVPHQPLFLTVKSCSMHPVRYEISVSSGDSPAYLTQNYASLFTPNNLKYQMLTAKRSESLFITVDSCDSTPIDSLKLTATKTRDNPNPEYSGSGKYFTTKIHTDAIPKTESEVLYVNLLKQKNILPVFMSVFTSTKANDPRPSSGTLTASYSGTKKQDKTPQAIFDISFDNIQKGQTAQVYLLSVDKALYDKKNPDAILEKVNMHTPCGIRMNRKVSLVTTTTGTEKSAKITVDLDSVYLVNVIVRDPTTQLEQSYFPIVINRGQVVNKALKFSVGALFILFAIIAIVAYLIVGISYNLFKGGKQGVELFPHANFWLDVPHIILDGIKFIVYCGRTSTSYSVFEDEGYGGEDTESEPNPFRISNMDRPTTTSSSTGGGSGYGAI